MLVKYSRGSGLRGALRSFLGLFLSFGLVLATAELAAAKARFAAAAVDARTGEVLFASDIDGLRHPASLTKVMTLYLLFQDLKAKRISLKSKIRFSRKASAQAPSKLGIKPGQTITVDTAIRALVTKSANDVAVAVAETLGGSEIGFANRMTRTARALGMSRTTFRNASGLPHPSQWTTARDMATLSLRIQRDFPQYYPYFALRSFVHKGRVIRSHNRLLGRYSGLDGIKTGYIRASGFNLTSSARRGDKRIVGVVLGAPSPGYRNRYMTAMLDRTFPRCKSGKQIALGAGIRTSAIAAVTAESTAIAKAIPQAKPDVPEPLEAKFPAPAQNAVETTTDDEDVAEETGEQTDEAIETTEGTPATVTPPPAQGSAFETVTAEDAVPPAPPTPEALPFQVKKPGADDGGQVLVAEIKPSWHIQIGAFPSKKAAESRLAAVRKKAARAVAGKEGLTMEYPQGGSTIYRARFTGFTEKSARAACKRLEAKGFGCLTLAPQS